MTITVAPARSEYTANAGQTIFNYTFKIFESTDLNVYVTPAGQECSDNDLTTAYTVSGIGDPAGGSITLNAATNDGDLVTIVSAIPSERTTDYQNNGDFRPNTVNEDFDRVVSIVKKIEDKVSRSPSFDECYQGDKPLKIEPPKDGQSLVWNGSKYVNYKPASNLPEVPEDKLVGNFTNYDFKNIDDAKIGLTSGGFIVDLVVSNRVSTQGRTTSGDGGNGHYIVVPGGTGVDDGGTYHDLANGLQLELIYDDAINIKQYGAPEIDVALASNNIISNTTCSQIIVDDEYTLGTQNILITRSNLKITGNRKGKLNTPDTVNGQCILATGVSNVSIEDLQIEGTDSQPLTGVGLQRAIQFTGCNKIRISGVIANKQNNAAIVIDSCDDFTIDSVHCDNNYTYGIEVRNGCTQGSISNSSFSNNGVKSGQPDSTIGRGIVIWQSSFISVDSVQINGSTEYDLRIYSQVDDTFDTRDIQVNNLSCRSSANINFYIYNESGRVSNVTCSNLNIRQDGTGKQLMSLQGDNITISNGSLVSTQAQQNVGVSFFNAERVKVSNFNVSNVGTLVSYGNTNIPNLCTIDKFTCTGLAEIAGTIFGAGHSITNSFFSMSSAFDLTAITLNDSYSTKIDNNIFDNAWRCITMTNSPSTITNNESINTRDLTIRKFGQDLTGLVIHSNSWDVNPNPKDIGFIDKVSRGVGVSVTGYSNVSPATFTATNYPLRTIFYSTDQGLTPNQIGWVKTAAGVPGTWKLFGDIQP